MAFRVPTDSLFHQYHEAYRQFTWEGVRVPSGMKVLPKFRTQNRPNCIFVVIVTWMEASLRLYIGMNVRLSVEDLEEKVLNMTGGVGDRTLDCLKVLQEQGICSEDDYKNKVPDCTTYSIVDLESSFALNAAKFKSAVEHMRVCPLLIVFHVGSNYYDYVVVFQQLPNLSYERFEEGKMAGHACCAIGHGVEEVVPFWRFMNSVGKVGPTKGVGRVLPQHCYYLYWHNGVRIKRRRSKRKRQELDADDTDIDLPPMKKRKVEHFWYMDQDNVILPQVP